MTLTVTQAWIDDVRAGRSVCWEVTIERGANSWVAVSGDREIGGAPPSVVAVEPAAIAYDPGESRLAVSGRVTVVFARDGWIEAVVAADWLRGAKVTIKLGPRSLNTGAWVTLPLCYVVDLEIRDATIGLVCEEYAGLLSQPGLKPRGVNLHPLEVIEAALTASGIPSSAWSATSLDPEDAGNASIAHLNVTLEDLGLFPSNANNQWPPNANPAPDDSDSTLSLAEAAMTMIGGLVKHNENGEIEIGRSGGSGSTVRNWTVDDVSDVRQVTSHEAIATRFLARFIKLADSGQQYWTSYQAESVGAQDALSPDASTGHVVAREIDLRLCSGSGRMFALDTHPTATAIVGLITGTSTAFRVSTAGWGGWTGCRFGGSQIGSTAIPSWARVSASKPAYVMLYGNGYRVETGFRLDEDITKSGSARPEIIKIDTIASVTSVVNTGNFVPVRQNDSSGKRYPADVQFTIAASGRAQFGTSTPAVAWRTGTPILDVTVPVLRMHALLGRYDYGVPFLELSTGLHEWPVELGDLVTLTHPTPVVHKAIGCDTSHVWEIVGKELIFGGQDSPRIQWTLAWYTDAVKPTHTITVPTGMGVRQVGVNYGDTIARVQREAVSLVSSTGARIVSGTSPVGAPASVLLPY